MKKNLILLFLLATTFFVKAQRVGINTPNPQATLDVKGSQRFGGVNNYLKYDSSGRIEWINSNLYVPVSQFLMKHSAAGDGLYYNNNAPVSGQLEYRNALGDPVFFTNFTNGKGYFSGDLGVGITTPQHKLHLFNGVSGSTAPFGYNLFALESGGNINMSFLTPDANESTIWFSKPSKPIGGGISYNNPSAPDGFIFRANNAPRMTIANTGNIGIGVNAPYSPLTFNDNLGEKISLYGTVSNNYGLGIQGTTFQIHSNAVGSDIAFGYGNSNMFTEGMRIKGNGNVGIGMTNPQYPLDINGRIRLSGMNPNDPGIWLNAAGAERAFIGLQDNTHVGFYGSHGTIEWGFTMNTLTGALSLKGNKGLPGQVLQSNGSNAAPTWSPGTNFLYNNTILITNNSLTNSGSEPVLLAGMTYTFTINGNAKVLVSYSIPVRTPDCGLCDPSAVSILLMVDGVVSNRNLNYISNSAWLTITNTKILSLSAGTHTIALFGDSYKPVEFNPCCAFEKIMNLQIIPE